MLVNKFLTPPPPPPTVQLRLQILFAYCLLVFYNTPLSTPERALPIWAPGKRQGHFIIILARPLQHQPPPPPPILYSTVQYIRVKSIDTDTSVTSMDVLVEQCFFAAEENIHIFICMKKGTEIETLVFLLLKNIYIYLSV